MIKHNNSSNARAFAGTAVLQGAPRNNMHIHRLSKAMTRKFMRAQTGEIMKLKMLLEDLIISRNYGNRGAATLSFLNNTTKIQLFL